MLSQIKQLWANYLSAKAQERRRKMWTPERQLEELRKVIAMDSRWLAHDHVASELTERYLKLLQPNWFEISTEEVSNFRDRIYLNPHRKQP